jgi:hypothetical protein
MIKIQNYIKHYARTGDSTWCSVLLAAVTQGNLELITNPEPPRYQP